jgi:hypothetical protein
LNVIGLRGCELQVSRRGHTRELNEVAAEVRLIGVTRVHGQLRE